MFGIKRIEITNFRSIRHLEIDCSMGINCFIGNNGAGKSSVLDALRILLSWFVARVRAANGKGLSIVDGDITNGQSYCLLSLTLINGVRWQLYRQRTRSRVAPQAKTELAEMTQFASSLLQETDNDKLTLPTALSYGVNRAVLDVPLRLNRHNRLTAIDAYDTALDDGANYRSFFEWFREREDIENEYLLKNQYSKGTYKYDIQLQAVRMALNNVLHEYGGLKVQRSPRALVLTKNGKKMDFRQLSDGEKCYITLVGDVARKLAMTHPASSNPLQEAGVVLIDEVDLHLHPTWQSTVMANLRTCFPKCQFFIATHSPFVISNLKDEDSLRVMMPDKDWEVSDRVYGMTSEQILKSYFMMASLRNPEVHEHLAQAWKLLRDDNAESEAFEAQYSWLLNNLPPSDPVLSELALQKALLARQS